MKKDYMIVIRNGIKFVLPVEMVMKDIEKDITSNKIDMK